ncbi:2-amino-4-hydroxy-6-hydroxymethyldihydropteridine diphosphokinase [Sphingobium phenoxybenzoativorans]|uniref:2-amino-4-hydroxy-6- hydroxymethyldihydropteridine diphosphokinase n=1 Tax=Sphingobium phenoxybenzoativorans TaxID=1592790 RepID=UPI000873477D|nr:2-amino-4-hydroxy-6-hydroxymethyldihydropteridine diphosphokinase [Sphingobium phenoxybenzoativorans]
MTRARYALALGSNRPLSASLPPRALAAAAAQALGQPPLRLIAISPLMTSRPLGPSQRLYINAAAIVEADLPPPALLAHLKVLERRFGRRGGRRWGARTLDLDIILWSGGAWASRTLQVPHRAFRERRFVLAPLAQIAPAWRDPATGLTIRHILARTSRSKPVDRTGKRL